MATPEQAVNQIVSLSDGSLIIVNDDYRSLFKTTDAGQHWRKLREGALRAGRIRRKNAVVVRRLARSPRGADG